MKYILLSTPMAPTVNEYLTVARGRMIKTSKFRLFEQRAIRQIKQELELPKYINQLKEWTKSQVLRVDCYFIFNPEKVFTKTKKAKSWVQRIDVHNRLKPLHDVISKSTEVDDSFYFEGDCVKATSDPNQEPYVLIKISPTKPKTIHDVLRMIDER